MKRKPIYVFNLVTPMHKNDNAYRAASTVVGLFGFTLFLCFLSRTVIFNGKRLFVN